MAASRWARWMGWQGIGAAIRDKTGTARGGHALHRAAWDCRRPGDPAAGSATAGGWATGCHYYSNPEFLREGSSVRDFRAPPFTLIGAPPGDDAPVLREIYAPIDAPVHVAPYRVAESVKHISNVFHAVKLTFANEAGAILAAYGVDAREALRLLCEDRVLNISPAYLRPGFAFGGIVPAEGRAQLPGAGGPEEPRGADAEECAAGQQGDHRPHV